MISALFFYNRNQKITRFEIEGHAGYAEYGSDIICSAVSALAINTINSMETLVKIPVACEQGEDGRLFCEIHDTENPEAQLLMQSLKLGLDSIRSSYGKQYLNIKTRNV